MYNSLVNKPLKIIYLFFVLIFVCLNLLQCAVGFCTGSSNECPNELRDSRTDKVICNANCYKLDNDTCEIFPPSLKHETHKAHVILSAVPYENRKSVAFNFTVYGKVWQRLKIKLYRNDAPVILECVEYTLEDSLNSTDSTTVLFDIPFNYNVVEGKTFHLDYELISHHLADIGRLVFNSPVYHKFNTKSLELQEPFAYIDITNLQMLTLRIQTVSTYLGYHVEVWRQRGDFTREMDIQYFKNEDASDGQIAYSYYTYGSKGLYYFTILADHPYCSNHACIKSFTPVVYIGSMSNTLVIGIVCASVMIPILLSMFYMWNKRCKVRTRPSVYTT